MIVYKILCHIICIVKKMYYKLLYGKNFEIGKGVTWRRRFNLLIDKGASVFIGDNCFFNNDCSINSNISIHIGEDCLFGEGVKIYDHNHRFRDPRTPIKNQGFSVEEIVIGRHCWIGSNVIILKGTHIGDNCVIGAGVVASGNIESNCIIKNTLNNIEREKIQQ